MTGQELETAVRYRAPIVALVMRNGLYGTIAMHQLRGFGATAATDIGDVDLVKYAESLGAVGYRIRDAGDLGQAMKDAMAIGRPALVDIPIDAEAITPDLRLSELRAAHARRTS
jgi:acetolactate synthase I/II/III large subunit